MSSYEHVQSKKGLGRGLGSLLGDRLEDRLDKRSGGADEDVGLPNLSQPQKTAPSATVASAVAVSVPDESRIWSCAIEKVAPNPRQPRKDFDPEKLKELAASVKEKGILQPIVVRKADKGFEIIAGERRWRAAQLAGLQEVPIIIRKADDGDSLELALIENIQRHDLNPIDEGEAYHQLTERFGLTQEQIAKKVGKERATITNTMRLISLVPQVKDMVRSGILSTGHAKVLLSVAEPQKQLEYAKKIVNLRLSVRAAEGLLKKASANGAAEAPLSEKESLKNKLVQNLSEELQKILGTKVKIDYSSGKGMIGVHFYSDDELTQIVERLRKSWKN